MTDLAAPGSWLCERYQLQSMQQVTPCLFDGEALDKRTGRPVAVHLFHSKALTAARWRDSFMHDAEHLLTLPDLGQPAVIDRCVQGELAALICLTMDGQPLIVEGQRHKANTVIAWALDIASLMRQLHNRSIPVFVARLCPDVLWQRQDGKATLLRFGVPEPPLETSFTTGVSPYQAPETSGNSAREATAAADTYWLGATMWLALTGTVPPSGLDRAARKTSLPQRPGIPDKLWQVVEAMLAMRPSRGPAVADIQRQLLLLQ